MIYRAEIDGLRAVAVMAVILYHCGFITGGYIGVDVFFVISGYLITWVILQDLVVKKFSFAKFYERRARRILPALTVVMLACLPLACWLLPTDELSSFCESVIATTFFVSNFLFVKTASFYQNNINLNPLLHTWSLAAEEQYYLLFPLFLFAVWRFWKKRILIILICLIVISLVFADYLSTRNIVVNFYLLPSRVWELMFGAMLAYIEFKHGRKNHQELNSVMPFVGILCIVLSAIFFENDTWHPGFITLFPVVGAVLIIWYSGHGDYVSKLLTSRVCVGIGLISYSLYLWGQPLITFLKIYTQNNPSNLDMLLYFVSVFFLAYISWRYIEKPFRNKKLINRKVFLFVIVFLSSINLYMAVMLYSHKELYVTPVIPDSLLNSMRYVPPKIACSVENILGLQKANYTCALGKADKLVPDFIVAGDSLARNSVSGFIGAAEASNLYGVASAIDSCVPVFATLRQTNMTRLCREQTEKLFHYIQQHHIKYLFLVARWDNVYRTDFTAHVDYNNIFLKSSAKYKLLKYALAETIEAYAKIGTQVIVVLQQPQQPTRPIIIYNETYKQPAELRAEYLLQHSVTRVDHLYRQDAFSSILTDMPHGNLSIIDLTDVFCDKLYCPVGTLDISYYSDEVHLTNVGSDKLTKILTDYLSKIPKQ